MSKTKLTFKRCHRCGEQIGWDETPNPICSDCAVERIAELEAENAKVRKCLAEARLAMMEPHGEWKDVREAKALNMILAEVDK